MFKRGDDEGPKRYQPPTTLTVPEPIVTTTEVQAKPPVEPSSSPTPPVAAIATTLKPPTPTQDDTMGQWAIVYQLMYNIISMCNILLFIIDRRLAHVAGSQILKLLLEFQILGLVTT